MSRSGGKGARKAAPRGRSKAAPRRKGAARSKTSPRPRRRIAAGLAVSFVLVLVLLVGVFPTRDWWAQRQELQERQANLDRQEAEAERLEERISVLRTEEEVERMAREDYGMVRPGEEAYQIAPPPVDAVELPDTWPFAGTADWLNR